MKPQLGILGKVIEKAVKDAGGEVKEQARSYAYNVAIGILEGLRDVVVDLSYTIALIGGGICIILHVAGWEKGGRLAGMLTVAYTMIKYLLG